MAILTSSPESIRADVSSAYEAWNAAFNNADAKALAALYAANAKVLPPSHQVISGPAEIEDFFAGLLAAGFTDHQLTIVEAAGDDRILCGAARWSANHRAAEGADETASGIATHIFEREEDGTLKLRLHIFN